MPVKLPLESRRPLRVATRPSSLIGSGSSSNINGPNSGSGISSGLVGGGPGSLHRNAVGAGLGPPDVYPQDPAQKEDELTAVHVKQGFTQSYSSLVCSEEYASAASKAANLTMVKILSELKVVQYKKEEANTLPDTGRKRQSLNTKDHFWLVTGRNKTAVDSWFRDLADGTKSLSWLAKRVPVFNKKEELLSILSEHEVPLARATWFLKMTAAYGSAMQETNKTKKRQMNDPSLEWTIALVRFMKDQLSELNNFVNGNQGGSGNGLVQGFADDIRLDALPQHKHWNYVTKLCEHMYHQGLLDRQEFLQWIVDCMEKYRHPEDPLVRLILTLVLQYIEEFVKSELLSRKLAFQCCKKISSLVLESEAIYGGNANNSSAKNSNNESINSSMHPVMSAFLELMEDNYTRYLIIGLSSTVQTITLKCPTSLVWNYFGENKTPSSLNGSPLDLLPNCSPSGLPMPPRQNNQEARLRIKQAETLIKERSMAAEARWSGTHGLQDPKNIGVILPILEALDSCIFERVDSSMSCLETLYNNLFSGDTSQSHTATLIHTLCEWATTSKRSGEHRAFVVAKLLEQRQLELFPESDSDETTTNQAPVFQSLLFNFLDLDAPTFQNKPGCE